jgi:hypothetical protein
MEECRRLEKVEETEGRVIRRRKESEDGNGADSTTFMSMILIDDGWADKRPIRDETWRMRSIPGFQDDWTAHGKLQTAMQDS